MRTRNVWLLPLLLAGCVQDSPTSVALEQRVFSALGGLEVGEVLELAGAAADTIFLPGRAGGAEFVVVPFLASEARNVQLQVEIQGGRASIGDHPGWLSRGPGTATALLGEMPARDYAAHVRRLEWERETFSRQLNRGTRALARARFARGSRSSVRLVPVVGETLALRVPNFRSNNLCNDFATRDARVVAVSSRAIVAADLANPPSGLTAADYEAMAREYDQLVYPVTVENFGEPTDIDENGRVIVLITAAINERTPPNPQGIIVGTFFAGDLLPRSLPEFNFTCPASNEGEIFYLIAPDPQGQINGNRFPETFINRLATTIIVHELQHLVNFGRRFYVNDAEDLFEEVWLNEGLSHVSEELLFYATTPFEPGQNISLQSLQSASQEARRAFSRFAADNINNYFGYLENPEKEALLGIDALPTRGASWNFLRYAADQEETKDSQFFFELVNSPISGIPNLERALDGSGAEQLMQSWSVSVYSDDNVQAAGERYQQPSWNFRSLSSTFTGSEAFPLKVQTLPASGQLRLTLEGGGAAFVRVEVDEGAQSRVRVTSGNAAPPGTLRVSVIRVR